MGVLDRGVPGTLEAGEGTGELVCEEDVSEAELLPEIPETEISNLGVGVRRFLCVGYDFPSSGTLVKPVFRIQNCNFLYGSGSSINKQKN